MAPSDPSSVKRIRFPRQPAWANMLGVLCIAVGVVGAGIYGFRSVKAEQAIFSEAAGRINTTNGAVVLNLVDRWSGKVAVANGSMAVLSAMLVAGGVLLLGKRRACAIWLKSWAVLKLAASGIMILIKAGYDRDLLNLVFAGTRAMAGDGAEVAASSARGEAILALAFAGIWLAALPGFVLFWFSRRKVRRRVEDWR